MNTYSDKFNFYCCMSSQNSYQSNVANVKNSKTNFSNYPQMLAPDGVHKTLFILKVVVKEVEVEMEVVVIQ